MHDEQREFFQKEMSSVMSVSYIRGGAEELHRREGKEGGLSLQDTAPQCNSPSNKLRTSLKISTRYRDPRPCHPPVVEGFAKFNK